MRPIQFDVTSQRLEAFTDRQSPPSQTIANSPAATATGSCYPPVITLASRRATSGELNYWTNPRELSRKHGFREAPNSDFLSCRPGPPLGPCIEGPYTGPRRQTRITTSSPAARGHYWGPQYGPWTAAANNDFFVCRRVSLLGPAVGALYTGPRRQPQVKTSSAVARGLNWGPVLWP